MKAITIKNIVAFRRKSPSAKKTLLNNLQKERPKKDGESGGDYWITSLSALGNCYKLAKLQPVSDKIIELEEKVQAARAKITKNQFSRNIEILKKYQDFDIKKWRPLKNTAIIKGGHVNAVITMNGLEVKVRPTYVIVFQKDDKSALGAIWFVGQLNGLSKEELGMFTEMLYNYLEKNFAKEDLLISPKYCIAVDAFSNVQVNYKQILSGEVTSILEEAIEEIKALS